MSTTTKFRIWRGDSSAGQFVDYSAEVETGMVVLDAVHRIQATQANDLAVRWNCKAGKCGSCSAEINGKPRLMCMTRMSELQLEEPVTVEPMHTFPRIKDLVTDVSWNYRVKEKIKKFVPRKPDAPDGTWRMAQSDVDRVQEFRKCIECYLCQDVCHVLRDHVLHEGLSGRDPHHRQRDHPSERARGRRVFRSAGPAVQSIPLIARRPQGKGEPGSISNQLEPSLRSDDVLAERESGFLL